MFDGVPREIPLDKRMTKDAFVNQRVDAEIGQRTPQQRQPQELIGQRC